MRKSILFFATIPALTLLGCAPAYTPTQAGGSGDEFAYQAPYGPYNGHGCAWQDTNCNAIYDYPGGGD